MRNRNMLKRKTQRWFQRDEYRATFHEFSYAVRVDDVSRKNLFETEKQKFFFLSKIMETLSKTESALDIASIKFRRHSVDIVLVANFNYTVEEVRSHMSVALHNYVVATTNSTEMLSTGQIGLWVGTGRDGWRFRGAYNASTPKAHMVIACGRHGKLAFPDAEAMRYYLQLMRLMQVNMPVEIVAYSITHNSAYFVMMSMDQSEVSIRRFVNAVNREYVKYYNTVDRFMPFTPVGNLFNPTLYCKEIKEPSKIRDGMIRNYPEIFDAIAKVHAQPVVQGLSSSYSAYTFSSYNDFFKTGVVGGVKTVRAEMGLNITTPSITSLEMLAIYLKLNTPLNMAYYSVDDPIQLASQYQRVRADYAAAHNKQPTEILDRFIIQRRDIFDITAEHALANYKVLYVRKMPAELFAKVVAEINELGDFTFDEICKRMVVSNKQRYNLLVMTAYEMIINRSASFDDVVRRLDVSYKGDQLSYDIILNICECRGFSYDYIMKRLEFSYPNIQFCKGLFAYASKTRGYDVSHLIKMFGIYDRGLINELIK